jgi:putative oxidoreductase
MKNQLEQGAVFLGRDLMALLILGGALQKANDPMPVMALIVGARCCAACGGVWAVTSVFHYLPDDPWQMTIFANNWSIAGGFLVLAVHCAGTWTFARALQLRP